MAARHVNPLRSDNIAAMYSSTAIAMIFTSLTGVISVLIDGIIASRFLGSDVYSGIALLRPFTSVVMLLASFLSTGCSFVCSPGFSSSSPSRFRIRFSGCAACP